MAYPVFEMLWFIYQWGRFVQAKYPVNIFVHRTEILLDSIDVSFAVILVVGGATCQITKAGCTQD